jgi:hypothetical protein
MKKQPYANNVEELKRQMEKAGVRSINLAYSY